MRVKTIFASALIITVLILLVISFFGVWYNERASSIVGDDFRVVEVNYYLRSFEAKQKAGGETNLVNMEYGDIKDNPKYDSLGAYVFDIAFYLTIFAIIFCIISFILLIIFSLDAALASSLNIIKKSTYFFTAMVIGLIFIIIILFAVLQDIEMQKDTEESELEYPNIEGKSKFWSDYNVNIGGNNVHITSGPGYAWYLIIISFILALLASIFLFIDKKESKNGPIR